MKEECLICNAPLVYLNKDTEMECATCHKKEQSRTQCRNGHYVCNVCHTRGIDGIRSVCLSETSKNPITVFNNMVALPFCHMHGPEHHILAGAALLTAYQNAGGKINLEEMLTEMQHRGGDVPGGTCGYWGACGAGISAGMFISIITASTPLSEEPLGLSNQMTAKVLSAIGETGGPRCCKRNSYLSILQAVDFGREHFQIEMEKSDIVCRYSSKNRQCIEKRCPFYKKHRERM